MTLSGSMSGTYGCFQWCGKVVNGMFRGREVGFDGVPYVGGVLKEVMVVREGWLPLAG